MNEALLISLCTTAASLLKAGVKRSAKLDKALRLLRDSIAVYLDE